MENKEIEKNFTECAAILSKFYLEQKKNYTYLGLKKNNYYLKNYVRIKEKYHLCNKDIV